MAQFLLAIDVALMVDFGRIVHICQGMHANTEL